MSQCRIVEIVVPFFVTFSSARAYLNSHFATPSLQKLNPFADK